MELLTIRDLKAVSNIMHDSEFGETDFGYDPKMKLFHITTTPPVFTRKSVLVSTRSQNVSGMKYYLELHNVHRCTPKGLNKVRTYEGIGGVFNNIRVRKKGRELTILSQDITIELEVTELGGRFETIGPSQ